MQCKTSRSWLEDSKIISCIILKTKTEKLKSKNDVRKLQKQMKPTK